MSEQEQLDAALRANDYTGGMSEQEQLEAAIRESMRSGKGGGK